MNTGFAHFDASSNENFSSALLCLVLEADEAARLAFVRLVCRALNRDPDELGPLEDIRREERLDPDDGRAYRRADLTLWFRDGLLLIEVKTHNAWDLQHVLDQLAAQRGSQGPVTRRRAPLGVVLLAPSALASRVCAAKAHAVSWAAVMNALRANPNPFVEKAIKHWETNVERPFGLAQPVGDFMGSVQVVACLRAFLQACANDIDMRPAYPDLNLTGWDGGTFSGGGWRWHGVSVPTKGGPDARIGIYRYVEAPPGHEASKDGAWLELYVEDPNVEAHYIQFAPRDLSAEALDEVRAEFRRSWWEKQQKSQR